MGNKPTALIILDGFGIRQEKYGNAVKQAETPNFDRYMNTYPNSLLEASGEAVGLPEGQMGNSEVGHLNIGAGRIVYQSLTRINRAIKDESFFANNTLRESMLRAKKLNRTLHLFGLLSDGGVHSHIDHLFALLQLAKKLALKDVYVHAFLDGRDVDPQNALMYVDQLEQKMNKLGIGEIATVSGRFYAMDRDQRWERIKKSYDAIVHGKGLTFSSAREAIESSYEQGITDEFVIPSVIIKDKEPKTILKDDDSVIFFNFRPDRALQLTEAFTEKEFTHFNRGDQTIQTHFVTMMDYSDTIDAKVAFEPELLQQTIGEVIANNGLTQLRIAETEKYPHVTYFISGGEEETFLGEKRLLIDSPEVATYDLKPEMSAYQVTDHLLTELESGDHDVIILNFANADMVGHSGYLKPTIKAIETVDECLGKIVDKILSLDGQAIITADHGNADEVISADGEPMTAHTTNPVPVIITKKDVTLRKGGILADLSPTLLDLLKIDQPTEMTGSTLIKD